jgi:cellulose synthase (UDP-forming)
MIELIPTSRSELWPYWVCLLLVGFHLGIAPLLPRHKLWSRTLMVTVGLATAVRYLSWRLLETVCPADLVSARGAWVLAIYALEVLCFVNYSVLFLILCRWVNRSAEADQHEAEVRGRPKEQLPSVDVFIPTYNEGPDVLHRTILTALGIDYPKFKVWVLDDGRRDWLARFCEECGAEYLRRAERRDAKAGNLNHGLSVSQGELFAIFDADFAPARNFLYRTVGFFSDPRIGIVQTPQHFFNPDPIQLNQGLSRVLPDEQRLFFDVIAPSRDAWNCAFCCGSCSVQRREAIAAVGGVPTESVTEDILSTLVLLRRGYITRYLNERLSMGLAAESLQGYFTQRARWCRGAIQTLFLRSGPLGPGLSLLQRLFFLPLDWLIQYALRLVGLAVPIVFLWTGVGPFVINSIDELIAYQVPAYLALIGTFRFFAPNRYIPVLSTAISIFTSLRIAPAALASLIKPFGTPFRVTPKGSNNAASALDRTAFLSIAVLIAVTLGGLLANRITTGSNLGNRAAMATAEVYGLFNLVVLGLAAVMALELPRPRNGERFPVRLRASFQSQGRDLPCEILDISETGALLSGVSSLALGDSIELRIPGIGHLSAQVVRRRQVDTGVRFSSLSQLERVRVIDSIYSSGLSNGIEGIDFTRLISSLFSFLLGLSRSSPGRLKARTSRSEGSPVALSQAAPSRLHSRDRRTGVRR